MRGWRAYQVALGLLGALALSASGSPAAQAAGPSPTPSAGPSPAPPAGLSAEPEVTTVRYGPFVLGPAGAGGDLEYANVVSAGVPMACRDCFILQAEPDLVEDGTSVNLDTGVMLHHAVFFNTGRPDTTCGGNEAFGALGERFLSSGNERTVKRLPEGYGYHLGHSPVNAAFHVMNHSSRSRTVYFTWRITWVPEAGAEVRPAIPLWLDINKCATSEYAVPAGPSSRHWQWTSSVTGRILATNGHVHDGGVRTTLTNATTGRHLCTSWASYGTKPAYADTIESMSRCAWDSLGTVRAGEVLDLEAVYDAAAPVDGAMGIMVTYLVETSDLDGGTAAPPEVAGAGPAPATSTPPRSNAHPHAHH